MRTQEQLHRNAHDRAIRCVESRKLQYLSGLSGSWQLVLMVGNARETGQSLLGY